jgi:hypothetical protein
MKNLKSFLVIFVGSLLLFNTLQAATPNVSPKAKFGSEVVTLLDVANYLSLDGEIIETTIIVKVNDENRLILVDSGTKNEKLDAYISHRLHMKKVWTRKVKTNFRYCLTVRFQPEN